MVEEIRQAIDNLNKMLEESGVSAYRLGIAQPKEFVEAEINARFMPKKQYDQLVGNIKKDKALSSLPFCWVDKDGKIHILSGHHRIAAANDAGVPWVMYLFTDKNLSKQEKMAIQLSHNSLVGTDDINVLRQQWKMIEDVEHKLYSGLDDVFFESFDPVELQAYNEQDLRFQTIEMMFLTAEKEVLKEELDKIAKTSRLKLLAPLDLYDDFVEALMRFKDSVNIFNTTTAIQAMIRVTNEYCDFLDAKREEALLIATEQEVVHEKLTGEGIIELAKD